MTSMRHFGVIFWKNIQLRRRKTALRTVIEVMLPVVAAILIVYLRINWPLEPVQTVTNGPMDVNKNEIQTRGAKQLIVAYAPVSNFTDVVMNQVWLNLRKVFKTQSLVSIIGFSSETCLLEFHQKHDDDRPDIAVIFRGNTTSKKAILCTDKFNDTSPKNNYSLTFTSLKEVSVRHRQDFPASENWLADEQFPQSTVECQRNALGSYARQGVSMFLYLTMSAVLNTSNNLQMFTQEIDCLQKRRNALLRPLKVAMPAAIIMSFLSGNLVLTSDIIDDRDTHIKDYFHCVGVNVVIYYLSRYMTAFLHTVFVATLLTLTLFLSGIYSVLPYSQPFVFFVFIILYGLTVISFTFWITSFYLRARTVYVVMVVWNIGQIAAIVYTSLYDKSRMRTYVSFLFTICYHWVLELGCYLIIRHETTGIGASWSNFFMPPTVRDNQSVSDCFLMLMVDASFFFAAGVIFRLTINHCLQRSYIKASDTTIRNDRFCDEDSIIADGGWSHFTEVDPQNSDISVELIHQKKVKHVKSTKTCFQAYKNQTTVVLGHSGSGKTELVRILTGITSMHNFLVNFSGESIWLKAKWFPKTCGVAFQTSVVFDELTVRENLHLYGQLKCFPILTNKSEFMALARQWNLEHKLDQKAGTLPRLWSNFLNIAIAFIGNPKIIILDEPDSGLNERDLDILIKMIKRKLPDRTTIITTSSCLLTKRVANRVAILAEGQIVCIGSIPYVASLLGAGYRISIETLPECHVDSLINYIHLYAASLLVEMQDFDSLVCIISESSTNLLEFLLANLRHKDAQLRIKSFTVTSIEMDSVLEKLRDVRTFRLHFLHMYKSRSTLDVPNLLRKSRVISPKIVYSAIKQASDGHFMITSSDYLRSDTSLEQQKPVPTKTGQPTKTVRKSKSKTRRQTEKSGHKKGNSSSSSEN